jgi:hypothetical protein
MCVTAGSLRKYFRDPEKFNFSISMAAHIQKSGKQEFILLGIILGIILLIMLVVTGIIPLGAPVSVIVQLVTKLSQAADGYLLGAVLLTIDGFYCAYQYISTLIEYDQREL